MKEMEKNFYRDEFEQMLRDTTDDFRMYPSRKVWHSIYNDLHPDRKWPSLTVCLLLISAILYIGVSNNNSINKGSKMLLNASFAAGNNIQSAGLNDKNNAENNVQKNITAAVSFSTPGSRGINNISPANTNSNSIEEIIIHNPLLQATANDALIKNITSATGNITGNTGNISDNPINFSDKILLAVVRDQNSIAVKNKTSALVFTPERNKFENIEINNVAVVKKTIPDAGTEEKNTVTNDVAVTGKENNTAKKTATVLINNYTTTLSIEEKSWIENFAFHNKSNRNKWKSNLSLQYYITPSVGYRQLYKNNDFEPSPNGLLLRTADNASEVSQQAAINLEAGTGLLFSINKKLRFKTGLQFNYSNYITYAHQLQHPTQTTVLMNDLNTHFVTPVFYNSNYGNILGSNLNKLNNKTLQLSLPVGLDYKLAGRDKVKWYVGASAQPTYISSGNAYLISADSKNFIEDASMLRNWNINTGVETFVSIKTPSGIILNAGPQFRYQVLSTYKKQYTYTEKLYNFGLKLGITKKL